MASRRKLKFFESFTESAGGSAWKTPTRCLIEIKHNKGGGVNYQNDNPFRGQPARVREEKKKNVERREGTPELQKWEGSLTCMNFDLKYSEARGADDTDCVIGSILKGDRGFRSMLARQHLFTILGGVDERSPRFSWTLGKDM